MNAIDKITLYTTQTKYYLIPADHLLPEGDYLIRASGGEERAVNLADIAAFEISQAQAEAHIKNQLQEGAAQVKTALAAAWQRARQKAKARREAYESRPPSKIVKELLGFTAGELRQKPELAEEQLHHFFGGLKTILESISDDDPAKQEAARAEIRALRERLEAAGFEPGQRLEQLLDKLHSAHFSFEREQRLRDTAAGLEIIAGQIEQAATTAERELRHEATRLNQQADNVEQHRGKE